MTEAEWWAATDPRLCVDWLFFDALASDRKLRLFSVAGCEPLRRLVGDPRVLAALDSAEAFADRRIDAATLTATSATAWAAWRATTIVRAAWRARRARNFGTFPAEVTNAETVCLYPTGQDPYRDRDRYPGDEDAPYALLIAQFIGHPHPEAHFPRLVRLLHDIFGPLPFRDVAVDPVRLTSDVLALARGIYDEKAFDRMPILADALQDAGCDNDEVLSHCRRADWGHVRGCWVLDLLLGRPWRDGA